MSQPPVRRHLMDPNAPRPVRSAAREQQSLTRVQRWALTDKDERRPLFGRRKQVGR